MKRPGKIISTFVLASMVALASPAFAADTITIKLQTSDRAGDETFRGQKEEWSPMLEKMTGGRLKIELFSDSQVVPRKETVPAMTAGVLGGHITSMEYHSGLEPGFALLGNLVAGYDSPDQEQMFYFEGPGVSLVQEGYDLVFGKDKVHVIGAGPYNREAFVSKVPIRGVDDLKGKKLRAPEGLVAEVFRRAGASTVTTPVSEVYTALEKGVIDGADNSSYYNNRANGMNRIAPYPIWPGIHSQAVHSFVISKKLWDSMTPDLQAALVVWWEWLYTKKRHLTDIKDRELVALDKSGKGEKVEVVDWSPEERLKLRKIAEGAWLDFSKQSPFAEKVYNAHIEFMTRLALL